MPCLNLSLSLHTFVLCYGANDIANVSNFENCLLSANWGRVDAIPTKDALTQRPPMTTHQLCLCF